MISKDFYFCSFHPPSFFSSLLWINRKLLAVLQKFKNNTQSETSSMAFTNFHSCLKNSFSLFAGCWKTSGKPKMKSREIMNNCSSFSSLFFCLSQWKNSEWGQFGLVEGLKISIVFCDKLCPVMSGKNWHQLNWVGRKIVDTLDDQTAGIKELRLWFGFFQSSDHKRSSFNSDIFDFDIFTPTHNYQWCLRPILIALMVQLYDFS